MIKIIKFIINQIFYDNFLKFMIKITKFIINQNFYDNFLNFMIKIIKFIINQNFYDNFLKFYDKNRYTCIQTGNYGLNYEKKMEKIRGLHSFKTC